VPVIIGVSVIAVVVGIVIYMKRNKSWHKKKILRN
jgi:uncharacterized membrane protein YozB (DUF420 family)